MPARVLRTLLEIRWRDLAFAFAYCPVCAGRRPVVRIARNEIGVRCLRCRSGAVTMSLVSVLRRRLPCLGDKSVYELSSRGPLLRFLARQAGRLTFSEYFDDVAPGGFRNGVQCQDVQRLTLASDQFDVCTATEVFEHVPDDLRAFGEMHRVLKAGGLLLFTVPLSAERPTVERAEVTAAGEVRHLLAPEYHADPVRHGKPVLAFRNYGADVVNRLRAQGFGEAGIVLPRDPIPWGHARPVVYAVKGR